jgi:pimeloyl-ACP methyl ester carboxylesterase
MPFLDINGGPIHYDSRGDGEPLLLIAGTGFSGKTWWPGSIERLSKQFRVITWDLRGTGESPSLPEVYSTRGFAEDAAELLRQLDAAPAHVLGHSMGGRVAQWLALDHPELMRTMILASSGSGRFPGNDQPFGVPVKQAVAMVEDGYAGASVIYMEGAWFPREILDQDTYLLDFVFGHFWSTRPSLEDYFKHVVARQDHQTSELLPQITVPTLVLIGDKDHHIGGTGSHFDQSKYIADHVPGAKLAIIPGAMHGLLWQEPDLCDDAIEAFIAEHSRTAAAPARR